MIAASRKKVTDQADWHAETALFQGSRQDDEDPLGGDHRDPVEDRPHPDEGRLLVLLEAEHVEAVGGDVVGGRAEGHDPEEGEGVAEEAGRRDRQGDAGERRPDQELHRDDPEPLRPEHVDEGAPERLDHPGEVEPGRVEGDVGIGDAETLVEDHRDRHGHDVGGAFGEVEGRDPCPGIPRRRFLLIVAPASSRSRLSPL